MISANLYSSVYLIIVTVSTIIISSTYSHYSNKRLIEHNYSTNIEGYLWPVLFTIFIGLRPISSVFVDTVNYAASYYAFAYGKNYNFTFDTTNYIFDNIFNWFGSNGYDITTLFVLIAGIYFIGHYIALRRLFPQDSVYAFIVFLGAFSTYSYATNGIKAGAAAALFLCAIAYYDKLTLCIPLLICSLGFHHSMIVPIVAFVICYIAKHFSFKRYFALWIIAVGIALAHITFFQELFNQLSSDDSRAGVYLSEEDSIWGGKTGFRLDFVIYSSFPILIGYYVVIRHKLKSRAYELLLNTYTLTNIIWMLCMYAPFTNRIAYLSWLMYPVVIIYPFLTKDFIPNQYQILNQVIRLQLLFLLAMSLIYYA